ncbi:MAG: HEPN domain-containing protein [Armatimonadota bacterium]
MRRDVRALLRRADENIEAAQLLRRGGIPSVAVSRCYYAMFYAVAALLLNDDMEFSSHGAVHAAFGQHFAKTARLDPKFHRYLLDAFRARQGADYATDPEISDEDAATLIAQAKELLGAAEQFLAGNR